MVLDEEGGGEEGRGLGERRTTLADECQHGNQTGVAAKGKFLLNDTTMIRAPRVLQLLAFRSKKTLGEAPLIRRLAIELIRWFTTPGATGVTGV